MKRNVLYRELAKYYDMIYQWKDYKRESGKIKKLISKLQKSSGNDLLEVGYGTGKHLKFFENDFSCTGIDLSKEMLAVARKNTKNSVLKQANMVNFDIDKKFDIILCLFSSIGYVRSYENLRKTINNFSKHLKTGGVLIIEPWFGKSEYRAGRPFMTTYDEDNIKIARLNVSKVENGASVLEFHYLVAEKNKSVEHFVDKHVLGLFERNETINVMKAAGLDGKFLKDGLMKDRGLFVAVKT
jgi:ubiquinone/menaquinone biosynthesis C-methylase UbiE